MSVKRNICVVGLGYVGLPVAVGFAEKYSVTGFDISEKRLSELKQGIDSTNEFSREELGRHDIFFTDDSSDIKDADFYIVTVPTPVDEAKQPDLNALKLASETVGQCLKRGDIVVYESTVFPGATEEFCGPILEEQSGLECGQDFYIAYSPERINPGDKQHTFNENNKVVAGQNEEVCEIVATTYQSVINAEIYKAPSIKVAEAAKVIENTQRDLNIALMNELAIIFDKIGIDTLDVLQAAETKWNFLPFKPGLVGGHCIGVDPYYLTHKATILGHSPEVILSGRNINDGMGKFIVSKTIEVMEQDGVFSKGSVITVLGLTFKENVPDLRNSKVMDLINESQNRGLEVQLHDPIADSEQVKKLFNKNVTNFEHIKPANAVIIAVAHEQFLKLSWSDINRLIDGKGVVFDIKGILPRDSVPENISLIRL